MSIEVSKLVWKFSRHKSGNLLVLLAIADHAHDDGTRAWPKIERLAEMTRLGNRQVRRCLCALEEGGELEIVPKGSPFGGTLYRIRLEHLTAEIATATPAKLTPVSGGVDADVTPSIREPSEETSLETDSHSCPQKIEKSNSNPTLRDALRFASQEKDVDPEVAETWWHECEACGWVDSHSRAIVKWQPALIAYSRKWEANSWRRGQPALFGDSGEKKAARQPLRKAARLSSPAKNGF